MMMVTTKNSKLSLQQITYEVHNKHHKLLEKKRMLSGLPVSEGRQFLSEQDYNHVHAF